MIAREKVWFCEKVDWCIIFDNNGQLSSCIRKFFIHLLWGYAKKLSPHARIDFRIKMVIKYLYIICILSPVITENVGNSLSDSFTTQNFRMLPTPWYYQKRSIFTNYRIFSEITRSNPLLPCGLTVIQNFLYLIQMR